MAVTAIDSIPVLSGTKSGKFNQMIVKVMPIRNSPLSPLTSILNHTAFTIRSLSAVILKQLLRFRVGEEEDITSSLLLICQRTA